MDRPEHTLHRRFVAGEFTIRSIELWRTRIRAIAEQALESMCSSQVRQGELIHQYALPIASQTIFEFLGVPASKRADLASGARILLGGRRENRKVVHAASTTFRAQLHDLVGEREARAGHDALGRLVARYQKAGLYSRAQLVEFVGALITAGQHTVATMIALSAALLIKRPAQRCQMFADKCRFALGIEELLRYLSVSDLAPARVAVADLEIGDVHIRAGEGVIASTAHANYDARRFADAARFDTSRVDQAHLAFGYGAHKCLGQHLARLELEVALKVLFDALPNVQLADIGALDIRRDQAILRVEEVWVGW